MDPDGVPCLVSPWFPNGNLIEYLQSHPNANRLSLASDVTKALRYLHSIPVVHGDLKGENILVNSNGSACLCDFGMSQFLDEALRITGFTTSTANTGGTNRYLAPELLDEVPKTTESDMWAFGCVIMQTLTDQLPYQQLNRPSALVLAITRGEPPYNQNSDFIRDSLWSCLTKCWSTDPEERPTISDLARHLYLNNS
ncbi:hypothetical protein FRC03_009216 [Tulasnella sp. 419]|nr:hypothetical protein FRC03_009216 [Tulasnella sp. 419]